MAQLGFVIVRSNFHAEFNFFNFRVMLFSLLFLLGQFVFVFSKISNATDGRRGIRRNLNEIESVRFCLADRILRTKDA